MLLKHEQSSTTHASYPVHGSHYLTSRTLTRLESEVSYLSHLTRWTSSADESADLVSRLSEHGIIWPADTNAFCSTAMRTPNFAQPPSEISEGANLSTHTTLYSSNTRVQPNSTTSQLPTSLLLEFRQIATHIQRDNG